MPFLRPFMQPNIPGSRGAWIANLASFAPATRLSDRRLLFARVGGGVVAVLGFTVLGLGWGLGFDSFRRVLPGLPTMAPNTALCLSLGGLSLWAATMQGCAAIRFAGSVAGVLVFLIALLALAQYATGLAFGTDLLLFGEAALRHMRPTLHPGRLALPNALTMAALGLALAMLPLRDSWARTIAGTLGMIGIAMGTLLLLGYVTGLRDLFGGAGAVPLTTISLHTALAFLVLGCGLLAMLGPDMQQIANPPTWLAVMMLLAIACAIVVSGDATAKAADAAIAQARRVADVRLALEMAISNLRDAETGQRGFLLTKDETYLEPYISGRRSLGSTLGAARRELARIAGAPAVARLDAIEALATDKLAELAETLRLTQADQPAAALALVQAGGGKRWMDAIRAEATALDAIVVAADAKTRLDTELSSAFASTGAIAMSLLACVALGLAAAAGRRADERDRRAATRLAMALDLTGVVVRRPDCIVLHWSAGMVELYGWTPAEAEGRRAHDVLRTAFPVPETEIEAALLRDGRWEGELVHHTRDGRPIAVAARWVVHANLLDNGLPVVIETAADVTALRAAELRLRLAQRIGHIGDFDYDLAADLITISEEYRVLHGLPDGEMTMTLGRWLDLVHPEDRAKAVAAMRGTAESGAPIDVTLRIIRIADTEIRWIASRAEVIRGPDGSPRRIVGTVQDVSDRLEAERRRSLVIRELNHRVKNILTVVQSVAAQTLRGASGDPARFAHDLGGRLQALARAHDLLTANDWTGARLGPVMRAALAPWLEAETTRITLTVRVVSAPPSEPPRQ